MRAVWPKPSLADMLPDWRQVSSRMTRIDCWFFRRVGQGNRLRPGTLEESETGKDAVTVAPVEIPSQIPEGLPTLSIWKCGSFRQRCATVFKILRIVRPALDFEHCDSNKPDKL